MPSSICLTCKLNLDLTVSLNKKRAAKNDNVAPIVDTKETMIVPQNKPNIAPPAKVSIVAPGSDKLVMTTYSKL